jgi:capsular polysaccharide biosynthesis protein
MNGPLEKFQWETLFKLGISGGKNLHLIQAEGPVLVKDAIVPTLFSNPIHSLGHVEWLRKLLASEGVGNSFGERVYISRKDAVKGNRQILNEDALIALLERYDFTIVRLGDLTLKQQASVFRGARYVVAPHGAGLANIIHAEPGACFIEMQANDAYTQVYWSLGLLSRAERYDILTCEGFGDFIPYQKNIEVDLERLESIVSEKWCLQSR